MLPSWLIRFVLALALAVLPLQGIAETVQLFLCQPHTSGHASQVQPAAHQHAAGGHHEPEAAAAMSAAEHAPADGHAEAADAGLAGGHAGHFCCDVVVAGLPSVAIALAAFEFPALAPAREVFHDSTFLERPQRPPLL